MMHCDFPYAKYFLLTVTLEVALRCASIEKAILISLMNVCDVAESCTVEPVYYGYFGTIHNCPNHQGVLSIQVNLYTKVPFGT